MGNYRKTKTRSKKKCGYVIGNDMNLKKLFNKSFWIKDTDGYNTSINADKNVFCHWSGKEQLSKGDMSTVEWKYLICLRKVQSYSGTIFGCYYERKLNRMTEKTGIWIPSSIQCGKGLIIAHWGRIIVNPRTVIGDNFSISSGVVIGRDIRGKRKGTPVFGNNVVIKTNACVVGNVHIGDDVLIAPNAYVNFDVPDHSIVIGNPGTIVHRENATEGYI